MLKTYLIILALLATQSAEKAHAQLNIPGLGTQPLTTLATQDSTLARAGLSVNDDDITNDQDSNNLALTADQLHEAKVWNLTLEESAFCLNPLCDK